MNGIGHAIVLAKENDTPDRWGIGAPPFPAKQGLGLPAVGIPSPASRGGALKQFALAEREELAVLRGHESVLYNSASGVVFISLKRGGSSKNRDNYSNSQNSVDYIPLGYQTSYID